jgi:hypothetical protein
MRFVPIPLDITNDTVLDDFARRPFPTQRSGKQDKPKPSPVTIAALKEIDACTSMDEFKRAKGYLSAAAYRVFAQCERRR